MSLSDSEGSPRICPTEGTNTQRSEVPRIGLSWKKKKKQPGLVRHQTGDSTLYLENFRVARDLYVFASQLRLHRRLREVRTDFTGGSERQDLLNGSQMGRDVLGSSVGEDVLNHPVYDILIWQPEQTNTNTRG